MGFCNNMNRHLNRNFLPIRDIISYRHGANESMFRRGPIPELSSLQVLNGDVISVATAYWLLGSV